jgi:environmental stress-induced protein Ves
MDDPQHRTRVIPANTYRRERWKNQLGWTREIARSPGAGDWTWRMSIAEIEEDAPFSRFDGIERELVLLSGNGLKLQFDDGEVRELLPPHEHLRFAGERAVTGVLVDGPTQDFNLMWRRDAIQARLWHRPLVGPMVVFVEPGSTWAIHLVAGQARFADDSGLPPMAAADTALLVGGATSRQRFVLDGGGEVLVMQLQPQPS